MECQEDEVEIQLKAVVDWLCGRTSSAESLGLELSTIRGLVRELELYAETQQGSDVMAKVWKEREEDLNRFINARHGYSPFELKDFDWSVRVRRGSDGVAGPQSPLLFLELTTQNADGQLSRETLELDAREVDSLLATMSEIFG